MAITKFELNENEKAKYEKWLSELPPKADSFSGNQMWIKFMPTGIGVAIKAGREDVPFLDIDLTDYGSW